MRSIFIGLKVSVVLLLLFSCRFTASAQTFANFFDFNGTDGDGPNKLIEGFDGNLYGTTAAGGAYGMGTVFKLTLGGSLTTLYSFCSQPNCLDGSHPDQLVQGADGNFYGVTWNGGAYTDPQNGNLCGTSGCGTVFSITPQGSLTTLHNFCAQVGGPYNSCSDGNLPMGPLLQASDGNFYGHTLYGGAGVFDYSGTAFKITPQGTFSIVYNFCTANATAALCPDGSQPESIIQGNDGNFYGTTLTGGNGGIYGLPSGSGTIFRLSSTGVLTTLYAPCVGSGCGGVPVSLIQGSDGNFYGYAGDDALFKVTPNGEVSTLVTFCSDCGIPIELGIIQASDGNLYGATQNGGTSGEGTIFSASLTGLLTTIYSACVPNCLDAGQIEAGPMQASDGNLYGSEQVSSAAGGAIFRLSTGLPLPSPTYTLQAAAPTSVAISPGGSVQSTLSVIPVDLYSGLVTLSCSISPNASPAPTCSFGGTSPVQVSGGAGSATLTFTAVGPTGAALRDRKFEYTLLTLSLSFVGTVLSPKSRGRKLHSRAFLCATVAFLIVAPSCGGSGGGSNRGSGGNSGTPPGIYSVSVTGTDSNGTAQAGAVPVITVTVN